MPAWGTQQPAARRGALAPWVSIVLWVGVAFGIATIITAAVIEIGGSELQTSDRVFWLLVGIAGALATSLCLAAVGGLRGPPPPGAGRGGGVAAGRALLTVE